MSAAGKRRGFFAICSAHSVGEHSNGTLVLNTAPTRWSIARSPTGTFDTLAGAHALSLT